MILVKNFNAMMHYRIVIQNVAVINRIYFRRLVSYIMQFKTLQEEKAREYA